MSPKGSGGWVQLRSMFSKRLCRSIEPEEDCSQEGVKEMTALVQIRENEDLNEAVTLKMKRKH